MAYCVFCKIAKGEIPIKALYDDGGIIAFTDKHPMAPVHVVIIPKEHIPSVADFEPRHEKIAGKMLMAAKKIAEDLKINKDGYKLLIRTGRNGGQEIDHVHLHLLGGAPLSENIHPL